MAHRTNDHEREWILTTVQAIRGQTYTGYIAHDISDLLKALFNLCT